MSTAIKINIKRKLAEQNISAAELERRTGIPHAVVNILHGRSKNPSLRTAQAIASELGCSVEDLIAEQPNKHSAGRWNEGLYLKSSKAVCNTISDQSLDPDPDAVSSCVSQVYQYTLDSNSNNIDFRFVSWIVQKELQKP